MKKILMILLFLSLGLSSNAQNNESAIRSLLKRVIPNNYKEFDIEYIEQENGKDVFEIESGKDKIILRGNSNVGIASALNYYLKNFCNIEIFWNTKNPKFPDKMPVVLKKIRKSSPHKYRYYLNYVTFNYSLV